jgi:hypothetical protein
VTTLDGMNADYRDVISALCDAGAEFMIVGAYAVAFHGHPRATGDIDLWVRPTSENARRVHAALLAFGAPLTALGITIVDLEKPEMVCQLGQPPRRVDVLTSISGVVFESAWRSRETIRWCGHDVAFLGRDALANKRAAGRTKDLDDVRRLESGRP